MSEGESILPAGDEPLPPRALRLREFFAVMGVCVLAQLLVAFAAAIGIDAVALARHQPLPGNPSLGARTLFAMGLVDAGLGVLGAWWFACARRGLSFADGLRARIPDARTLFVAAAAGAACVGAEVVLVAAIPSDGDELIQKLVSTTGGFAAFAVLGLLSPFAEEIYYRGFFFTVLEDSFKSFRVFEGDGNTRAAAWIVGLWFTLLHMPQYWPNVGGILAVGVLSAATTTLRARTGSIVPGILTHFVYNATLLSLAVGTRLIIPAR